MDVPFKRPNWLGSILFLISSIIHVTPKSSKTVHRQGVRDIGLKSPLENWVFGIVLMFVSFQITGTIPEARDALKIVVTGSTNSYVNSFRIRHGTLSGPWSLKD